MLSFYLYILSLSFTLAQTTKRGLCYVHNEDEPQDDKTWVQNGSDITWYYNYKDRPSPVYSNIPQDKFEFIPMMWGVGDDPKDTTFLKNVKSLIEDGVNITHVLGFNEPNAGIDVGGSNIDPKTAAQAWVANFEPLGQMGIKLGLPACTGGWDGFPWLLNFIGNCSEILSQDGPEKNCTWDFLPVHWYDNFEGLASHIGERLAQWPDAEIWVTEYALAHQELNPTKKHFETTLEWLDREDFIGRYTYFGAFRSDISNVGPNAAFLNNDGDLTKIGKEYLGLSTTVGSGVSKKGVSILGVLSLLLLGW